MPNTTAFVASVTEQKHNRDDRVLNVGYTIPSIMDMRTMTQKHTEESCTQTNINRQIYK